MVYSFFINIKILKQGEMKMETEKIRLKTLEIKNDIIIGVAWGTCIFFICATVLIGIWITH